MSTESKVNARRNVMLVVGLALLTTLGCDADNALPQVSGVVTLDGAPVPKARVSFFPARGRAAVGITNEDGYYQLSTSKSHSGAAVGEYTVSISTWTSSRAGKGADAISVPGTPELIPSKLTSKNSTNLRRSIAEGSNSINFNLESQDSMEQE